MLCLEISHVGDPAVLGDHSAAVGAASLHHPVPGPMCTGCVLDAWPGVDKSDSPIVKEYGSGAERVVGM